MRAKWKPLDRLDYIRLDQVRAREKKKKAWHENARQRRTGSWDETSGGARRGREQRRGKEREEEEV